MPDSLIHFRDLLPVFVISVVLSVARTLVVGHSDPRIAIAGLTTGVLTGFAGGWIAQSFGVGEGWALLTASLCALGGRDAVLIIADLWTEARRDPAAFVAKWAPWLRRGGRDG